MGKQGLTYFAGVSAENTGARQLCLHLLVIPPLGRARAHLHENHESAIYLIDGTVHVWWGEGLSVNARMSGGDFIYIPPGVPHLPVNTSATEPVTAVVARTDPQRAGEHGAPPRARRPGRSRAAADVGVHGTRSTAGGAQVPSRAVGFV